MCKINYLERGHICSKRVVDEHNGCHSKYIHRKTGLGAHTRHTDTHRLSKKSLYTDFTLFNMDFGFVDSERRHSFTSQPWICLFLYIYIYFFFLSYCNVNA